MSSILNVVLWSFIPSIVTSTILKAIHSTSPSGGPPPGSVAYVNQYRAVTILVIGAYLLYTLYAADREIANGPPNFYDLLGVPYDISPDDSLLRKAYKRATLKYHPDKAGKDAEGLYMSLKGAYETLSEPVKRFGYDRFGVDVLEWQDCEKMGDYVNKGIWNLFMWYGGSGVMIFGLQVFKQFEGAKFWRFFCLLAMLVFEGLLITRSQIAFPSWVPHRPLLPFEIASLARKAMLTIFMAFNQIGPILRNRPGGGIKVTSPDFNQMTKALNEVADRSDNLANALVAGTLLPFKDSAEDVDALQEGLRKQFVEEFIQENVEKKMRERMYEEANKQAS